MKTIPAIERIKTDAVGPIDIPDPHSFYCVMTQNTINILSSRRNQITKTIDVIDLNILNDIDQSTDNHGDLVYTGGLGTMGMFDEGRCFQINLKNSLIYVICSSD